MPMSAGNLNGQDVCCETKTRRQRTIKCFIKLKGTGESVILPLPSCSSWRAAAFHMFSKMQMHLVRGELKAKLRHIYGITGARSSFFLFSPLTAVTLSQLILITIKPTHTHTACQHIYMLRISEWIEDSVESWFFFFLSTVVIENREFLVISGLWRHWDTHTNTKECHVQWNLLNHDAFYLVSFNTVK